MIPMNVRYSMTCIVFLLMKAGEGKQKLLQEPRIMGKAMLSQSFLLMENGSFLFRPKPDC